MEQYAQYIDKYNTLFRDFLRSEEKEGFRGAIIALMKESP